MRFVERVPSSPLTLFLFMGLFATILACFWLRVDLSAQFLSNLDQSGIDEICDANKGGDIYTYCTVGREFAQHGFRVFVEKVGSFIFWPPGQFFNFALATFFLGTKAPVFNFMVMHIYLLWLGFLIMVGYLCSFKFGKLGYLIPLSFFLLPEFNQFLAVTSVYLSDPCGAVYFLAGMSVLMFAKPSLKISILGGIFLVISAYYRSPNEAAIIIMLLGMITAIFYASVKAVFSNKVKFKIAFANVVSANKFLLMALVVAITLTIPWRIFTYVYDNHRVMWTRNFPMEVLVHWYEPATTPAWLAEGGGAMACKYAPDVCQTFHQPGAGYNIPAKTKELLKVIIKYPVQWVTERTQIFVRSWLMPYPGEQSILLKSLRIFLLAIFLFYPLYVCIRFLFSKDSDIRRVVLLGSSLVVVALMLLVVHIEYRYLYPYKLLALLYCFDLCLALKEYGVADLKSLIKFFRQLFIAKAAYSQIQPTSLTRN